MYHVRERSRTVRHGLNRRVLTTGGEMTPQVTNGDTSEQEQQWLGIAAQTMAHWQWARQCRFQARRAVVYALDDLWRSRNLARCTRRRTSTYQRRPWAPAGDPTEGMTVDEDDGLCQA